jgi:hypothetical protein
MKVLPLRYASGGKAKKVINNIPTVENAHFSAVFA